MTGPTAAPARFPYAEHRTMAQVMADEVAQRKAEARAKISANAKAVNSRRTAWCPPHMLDDYRLLARHLGAGAARQTIEAQIAANQQDSARVA